MNDTARDARPALEHDQGHQLRDVHHAPRQRPPARAADDDAEQGARRRRQPVVLHVEEERPGRRPRRPIRRSTSSTPIPATDTYVSVSGTAAMLDDAAKKQQLWNKLTEAWFPGGPTDPDLALVQVADRPRQLLGREGEQAGPALRDGQGGRHRQAAASSASTAKCACAERGKGHAARPRRGDLARRAWRCSALRSAAGALSCRRPLPGDRHAPRSLHASFLARLPLAAAARRDRMGRAAFARPARPPRARPGPATSPWDATRPAELERARRLAAVSRALKGVAIREVNEPDVFRHFFGR